MDDYPNDGRGASSSPGVWAELLSYLPNEVPWERLVVPLGSETDTAISRHCRRWPRSPISWALQFLFGRRHPKREDGPQ